MKTNLTFGLGIVLLLMQLSPMAFSEPPGQTRDEVPQLVKGLVITVCKSEKQKDTLIIRLENHLGTNINLLQDAVLHPYVDFTVESPDGNSAQAFLVTPELSAGGEDIASATQGKQISILTPGKSLEIPLKIPDLINAFTPEAQKVLNKPAGKVRISLSFEHLVIGLDGNKNSENAFNTTFKAPGCDLK